MQGGFVASPHDKTLPIQVHETYPGFPEPPCLGPWTGNREPRALDHRARTHVLPAVGCEVAERNLEVMIWSTLYISVAKCPVRQASDQLNGNDKHAQHYVYYGY